jgi:hypothetical protein
MSEHRLRLSAVITNQLLCQLSYAGVKTNWNMPSPARLVQRGECRAQMPDQI